MLWPCIQRQILPRERCSRVAPLHSQVFPQVSAPGRIRTRDPLLRRQLLCPAELRAPEGNCARGRSRDGYARVADCRAFEAVPPREKQGVDPEDFPSVRAYLNLPSAIEPSSPTNCTTGSAAAAWTSSGSKAAGSGQTVRLGATSSLTGGRYRPGPQSGSVAVSEPSSAGR
jgi:hypothetical protein